MELNYFSMLGCHAYCITFIWTIIGLLENMSMEELLLCVSSLRELLDGERVWEFRSWGSVVSSHQLRITLPRKEAGDLPRTQLWINCNYIKIVLTLEYFTLSFDKLSFFVGVNPSVEYSGELCYNQSTSAEVATLKISLNFFLILPHPFKNHMCLLTVYVRWRIQNYTHQPHVSPPAPKYLQ